MKTLAFVLLAAYALLNLVLAYAGSVSYAQGAEAPWSVKLLPTALFVVAGLVLAAGLLLRNAWVIGAGLALASVAPVVYGAMVEGQNVVLHHAVRAALATGMMAVWLHANRVPPSA